MKSAIYRGKIRHRRFTPAVNEFTYSVCYFLIDLAEIDRLFRVPFLFSAKGPSLFGYRRKNYLGDRSKPLISEVRRSVFEKTGKKSSGPVRMLTQISYFGFCFNPVTFYYCYDDKDERVEFIVAEITNTPWGEIFSYVLECKGKERVENFSFPKTFHVSPFMAMDLQYKWLFSSPARALSVHMENSESLGAKHFFDATLTLDRTEISGASIAQALALHPLLTFKTVFLIYFQALKLWLKKVPFYSHPAGAVSERKSL